MPLVRPHRPAPRKRNLKFLIRKVHKWVGLSVFWWLAILGITGICLDHPDWRWQHQTLIPGLSTPVNNKNGQHLRHPRDWSAHFALSRSNDELMISGGPGGLRVSSDRGTNWQVVDLNSSKDAVLVYDIVSPRLISEDRPFIATDRGIWKMREGGSPADLVAFPNQRVTSLSYDEQTRTLLAVINRSKMYEYSLDAPNRQKQLISSDRPVQGLPKKVSLNRWGFDLHLGTGFFAKPFSILTNDFAGGAMVVLAISGILYWMLPRHWARLKSKPSPALRRKLLTWLYRFHVYFAGLLIIVPTLYLSATGIFLGHKTWFQGWSETIEIDHKFIPGHYHLASFHGEIESLVRKPGAPGTLIMLTRMGLLESEDDGRTWTYDASFPFDLHTSWNKLEYYALENGELVSDVIGRNFLRPAGSNTWEPIQDIPGYTVISLSQIGENELALHTLFGLHTGSFETGFSKIERDVAPLQGLDVAFIMRIIHGVLVFNWLLVWINDAMAIASLLMIVSGFTIWITRNRKWI